MLIYTHLVQTFLSLKDEKENDYFAYSKIVVRVHNFIVFEVKMREFFLENFAERVVILHNYPQGQGCKISICWSV